MASLCSRERKQGKIRNGEFGTFGLVASTVPGVRPWIRPWYAEHAAGRITRPLAGVYCELREQACKQIFVRELEALRRITHVGYYEAIAARPRVLTKACWARVCCEST